MFGLSGNMPWIAISLVAAFAFGFIQGNIRGPNALRYAAVAADLKAKNAILTKQLSEDAETVAAERADAEAKLSEFEKAAATFQNKCPLDQQQVEALNKLIGG